jgi:pyruvate/2-oxoglutarate dehydrogenase complex dihydrolipoamide acyltransferase (E2) component
MTRVGWIIVVAGLAMGGATPGCDKSSREDSTASPPAAPAPREDPAAAADAAPVADEEPVAAGGANDAAPASDAAPTTAAPPSPPTTDAAPAATKRSPPARRPAKDLANVDIQGWTTSRVRATWGRPKRKDGATWVYLINDNKCGMHLVADVVFRAGKVASQSVRKEVTGEVCP